MLLTIYHLTQAVLTAYTSLLSYTSITKVQTYESTTEKAARYSNIAEHHLRTTRTTMAAGAVSALASLGTSLYLTFMTPSAGTAGVLSAALAVGMTAAHSHVSNYWRGKAKVPAPGAGDYNDAITTSNSMRRLLGWLAASWGVVGGWYFFVWISS